MINSAATISAIFLAYIGDMDKNNYSNKHDWALVQPCLDFLSLMLKMSNLTSPAQQDRQEYWCLANWDFITISICAWISLDPYIIWNELKTLNQFLPKNHQFKYRMLSNYTTTWIWLDKCFGLSWHKIAIPLYMVLNELEIRMNRSRPTHTGAQLREPHPGFTTKFKLLERMKYKLSFLHPGVQRTCTCCLYFYGIRRNEFLSFWCVFNISTVTFPVRTTFVL